jgi:hypothetical protein
VHRCAGDDGGADANHRVRDLGLRRRNPRVGHQRAHGLVCRRQHDAAALAGRPAGASGVVVERVTR